MTISLSKSNKDYLFVINERFNGNIDLFLNRLKDLKHSAMVINHRERAEFYAQEIHNVKRLKDELNG